MPIDKSLKVLIVDQDPHWRVIHKVLNEINVNNADVADSSDNALSQLRAGDYGLVICSWATATINGLQVLQAVRTGVRRTLPFIMTYTSSQMTKGNVMVARQTGASNYIEKPFDAKQLREKIETVL